MMQCDCILQLLPCHVVAWAKEQDVLDGIEVGGARLPADRECAGGVLHLAERAVSAGLSVSAVGSNASPDPHHWVALFAEVQG
jgi:hypothetical protein